MENFAYKVQKKTKTDKTTSWDAVVYGNSLAAIWMTFRREHASNIVCETRKDWPWCFLYGPRGTNKQHERVPTKPSSGFPTETASMSTSLAQRKPMKLKNIVVHVGCVCFKRIGWLITLKHIKKAPARTTKSLIVTSSVVFLGVVG